MKRVLEGLEPQNVLYFFEEISRIPRNSHEEEKISEYLLNFAKERGLKAHRDECLNVFIHKPATPGFENKKGFILQGHMDMVCVKDDGVDHDFSKDPIALYLDGEFIKARGTTLGADDGNALALCLAILDADNLRHPDLQVVFTTAEETSLYGAKLLDGKDLKGSYFIGLDISEDDKILLSAASCYVETLYLPLKETGVVSPETKTGLTMELSGLRGGHSGVEIHNCRANAVKVLAGIVNNLSSQFKVELISVKGGDKHNAIPISATAELVVSQADVQMVQKSAQALAQRAKIAYYETDPDMAFSVKSSAVPEKCLSAESTEKLLAALDLVPHGVRQFLDEEKTGASASANMAVTSREGDEAVIAVSIRSNSDHGGDTLVRETKTIASLLGARCEELFVTSPWSYNPDSKLAAMSKEVYVSLFGETPEYQKIHGGVEAGIFIKKMEEQGGILDAINIGVETYDVHTTSERVRYTSFGKVYRWLTAILAAGD